MKNPLSKEAFLDWVEKQPADAEYNYMKNQGCAYYQYLYDAGLPVESVAGTYWRDRFGILHDFKFEPNLLGHGERTFGALAERLRNG